MADPIWLDTSAVINALRGDPALNDQLSAFRKAGRKLLITQQVETEALYGNPLSVPRNQPRVPKGPSPQERAYAQFGMSKIGVEVDVNTRAIPPATREIYLTLKGWGNVSLSDRTILAEIKASAEMMGVGKPQLLTAEANNQAMRTMTGNWGIESVQAAKSPDLTRARVNLKEYPPDEEGEISKFFKDRPLFQKLKLLGLSIAAQEISNEMMSEVLDHFKSEVSQAEKALDINHPDPARLKAQAGLEPFKRAYEAGLAQVSAAQTARVFEAVALAFTRDEDIDAVKAQMDKQIVKIKSAADGKISSFGKLAGEYVDALVLLYKKVVRSASGLDAIADAVEQRGKIVKSAGDDLEQLFWDKAPVISAFPLAYFEWLNVYNLASALEDVGGQVLTFANQVRARLDACTKVLEGLDQELAKVSEATYAYGG
jgi:uncharacterized protein YukE